MTRAVDLPRLRELRESRFLTQHELAARAGVGRNTIARIELGTGKARFSTIRKLAAALGVEPRELVGVAEEGKAQAP